MRAASQLSRNDLAGKYHQSVPKPRIPERPEDDYRSGYGSVPGDEFPAAVYRSIVIAFGWMMLAAWLAFGGATGTNLDLAIATVLFVVFLGLPITMYRTARNRLQRQRTIPKEFLSSRVDVATGSLSGREAWLEVILIPVALALAATLIGGAYVFFS
jgi:hypothetical protein